MNPNEGGIKTWQWVVTVIVIIVLIVVGVLVFGGKGSQAPVTEETPAVNNTSVGALNRITMTDQYPGNIVYLSSAQVANPSWVVIQTDKAGIPDKIIGSAHLTAGINPSIKITLNQPMIDGATYYATIYTDDGKATFSAVTDVPLKDSNGNIITKVFRASTSVGAGLKG